MKIGFDAKRYYNNTTGLGNFSRSLVNALIHFFPNNEYHLFSPKVNLISPSEKIQIHSYKGIFSKVFGAFWRSRGMLTVLKRNKIEIYHGLSHELPIGISKTKIKTVLSFHDLIFMRFPKQYPRIDRFFYERKYSRSCKEADIIVAISEQTKLDLMRFFNVSKHKIKVIYQVCDPKFVAEMEHLKSKSLPSNSGYYLFVGSIIERKNLFLILKTIKSLSEHGVEIHLKVVGNQKSDYALECIQFAKHHHLKVEFLKNVDTKNLASLYYNAKALVYPSLFEGFGIPLLEAMHAGIPTLASSGTCLEEVGGKCAIYVDPSDSDSIAEGFLTLERKENRISLIEFIPEQLIKFDPKLISQQWIDLYKALGQNN